MNLPAFYETLRITGLGMSGVFTAIFLFYILIKLMIVVFPAEK